MTQLLGCGPEANIDVDGSMLEAPAIKTGLSSPTGVDLIVPTRQAKLLATDGGVGDSLGLSISMAGDTVLTGAYQDDDKATNAGAAYVFTRAGTTWSRVVEIADRPRINATFWPAEAYRTIAWLLRRYRKTQSEFP